MKKIFVLLSMCIAFYSNAQKLTAAQEIMLMNTRPLGMSERQALEIISNFTPKVKYDVRKENISSWHNLLPYLHTNYYYREVGLLQTATLPVWYQTPHQLSSASGTRLDIGLLVLAGIISMILILVALDSFLTRRTWDDPKTIKSWNTLGMVLTMLLSIVGVMIYLGMTFSVHAKIHPIPITTFLYSLMFCLATGCLTTLVCALCVYLKRSMRMPKILQPV